MDQQQKHTPNTTDKNERIFIKIAIDETENSQKICAAVENDRNEHGERDLKMKNN